MNSRGEVVGFAVNGVPDDSSIVGFPTQTRAFRWQNGAMQDIGTLPGGTDAVALMVNEGGQIVGAVLYRRLGSTSRSAPAVTFP